MSIHPAVPYFKSCPFGVQDQALPGGRVVPESGKRFCNKGHRALGLVPLSTCLSCEYHGSGETPPPRPPKVGDVLAGIIKERHEMGITDHCDCDVHVADMNNWGPDGCEENIDTIVGWLIEGAKKISLKRKIAHTAVPKWIQAPIVRPMIREAIQIVRDWKAPVDTQGLTNASLPG